MSALPPAQNVPVRATLKSRAMRQFARLNWKLRLALGLPLAALAAGVPAFGVMMIYYTVTFPHPLAMRTSDRAPVIRILARDGSVLSEKGAAHDYMPLDLLPPHVIGAVVAIEDRRFFEHSGLDPWGFARAVFANLRAGRLAQGGSTLTQQLAKNLFLSPERTFARKLEELALALWLELRLSKADILELYLNRVYFGAGAYGIEAASQRYFDKSARALSVAEAAIIAGLLKAPSKYSPIASPEAARSRGRIVLSKMAETGVITPEQEARAGLAGTKFADDRPEPGAAGLAYAIDFVLERLPPLSGGGHGEIIVETTLDAALQKKASEIVVKSLARDGEALAVSQAAIVLLDNEGGIRALVGGRDYADSQFNRAVKARRQPGSAFKPFVYLTALERGMTPDSLTYDLPLTIDGWSPRNDNGLYIGEINLRRALAQSVNTVAVRLYQQAGTGRVVEAARRLGIKSELRDDASIALGTSEVSLLELTGAYGALATGGTVIEPHAIRRVRMSSGRVLYAREAASSQQVLDPSVAGQLNSMMHTVMTSGTGRRAAIPGHPAAGKTGTSQDFRDAWFVGYTSHLIAGVWIGNDNGKPMKRAVGGGLPAGMWRELMMAAHAGKAPLLLPGMSDEPAADADLPVAAAEPPRPPQAAARESAGQANQVRVTTARRRAPPVAAKANDVAPPQVYPDAPIGDDFIAKALADSAVETDAAEVAAPEPRERPKGMMSLGGWW